MPIFAFMPKRRPEDILFFNTPSKRRYSLCNVDMPLESMAEPGGVNPPSLLALFDSRCKKRPYHFQDADEEQATQFKVEAKRDLKRHAVRPVKTLGCFEDSHTRATNTSSNKRIREEYDVSNTLPPTVGDTHAGANDDNDDCTFNSFQYWRVPLPELNLSLLNDVITGTPDSEPTKKMKRKDSYFDPMET